MKTQFKKNIINIKIVMIFTLVLILTSSLALSINYPKLNDFVTDQTNLLTPNEKTQITQIAKQIEQETTAEIAIVIIESLESLPIETYAVELFETAGIGKTDLDNGLLILIAPNERRFRLEVGYGLEGTLPDILAQEIGNNILTPNFKKGEFGKGILDALNTIYGYLSNNEEIISKYKSQYTPGTISFLGRTNISYLILFILIIFPSILRYFFRKNKFLKTRYPIIIGGFGGHRSGGFGRSNSGFGGFGGGSSGGGGFSGGW